MSWYAPPDTVGIRFAASCHRISAINRRCRPDSLVCTFLRGSLLGLPRPYKRQRPQWLPLIGEGFGAQKTENLPAKRCRPTNPACTFYLQQIFNRNCSRIWCPISGGAYQDAREVSIEWNARPKYWDLPKIRCSMHPASPRTLFAPIFSLAREKMGPSETRQKRPRRNESLQARLLILCARFFLSKPQTKFAVWVFSMQICDNLSGA